MLPPTADMRFITDGHLRRGYIQSWNFTIQKELPWGFAGQVGYVATHSTRQLAPIDLNAGQIIGAGAAGKPYEVQWGRDAQTLELRPIGTGHFDSLQAQLQRRFTAGLALTMNYTWGKSINVTDNSSYQLAVNAQKYLDLNRSVTGFRGQRLGVRNVRRPGGKRCGADRNRRLRSRCEIQQHRRGNRPAAVSGLHRSSRFPLTLGPHGGTTTVRGSAASPLRSRVAWSPSLKSALLLKWLKVAGAQ